MGHDGKMLTVKHLPVHLFIAPGTYAVTLTVADADGDISVYQVNFTVQQPQLGDSSGSGSLWVAIPIIGAAVVVLSSVILVQKPKKGR